MDLEDLCTPFVEPIGPVRCGHPHHAHEADCPTPDDLSDVIIRQHVPIRYGLRGQERTGTPVRGDMRAIARIFGHEVERVTKFTAALEHFGCHVDTCARLREEYLVSESDSGHQRIEAVHAERAYRGERVRGLMAQRLTLRMIARYLDRSLVEVVGTLFSGDVVYAEQVARCDERMRTHPSESNRSLDKRFGFGYPSRVVPKLRVMQTPEGTMEGP
jgi:hypothetical protein